MRIILKRKRKEEGTSYNIPPEGITVHNALGSYSLEARPQTPFGAIRVLLWDPSRKPDRKGRIKPAGESVLNFFHPQVKFRRGLFGRGGVLQVTRDMMPK